MNISDLSPFPPVDLINCDLEPIRIPGRIQPYGLLFVLDPADLTISQVSANTLALISRTPESLLGTAFEALIQPEQAFELREQFFNREQNYTLPIVFTIPADMGLKSFQGVLHRNPDGLFILELEPFSRTPYGLKNFYEMVGRASTALQETKTLDELCQVIVHEIKEITHFDRVMVYQFDEDAHGIVIAETVEPEMEPFLGLHYPASDIPQQARQLYLLNWLRLIADVHYQAVDILPTLHPNTQQPVDLTHSFLRSVSPIHIEYLKNMDVGASMSISLIKGGQLWGLIACHHRVPLFVPSEARTVCEYLGKLFSAQLGTRREHENINYQAQVKSAQLRCVEQLAGDEDYVKRLLASDALLTMSGAQGVALCLDESVHLLGLTPEEVQIRSLINWLKENNSQEVFSSRNLAKQFPAAVAYCDTASGLLAIRISKSQGNFILWFRPEVLQTVQWAGDPNKPVEVSQEGEKRLTPRKSFAVWQQSVRFTSRPWQTCELQAAGELRSAVIEIVLSNSVKKLGVLNVELKQSNNDLDEFAYIASHDLKEPLRGIHNYASFLIEDYQAVLDEEGIAKLNTLVRLTQRMENLINSLLHFARVGRIDMAFAKTSLDRVLRETIELLQLPIQESGVQIRVPRPLPTVACDQIRIGEVFSNLIVNAIKYNHQQEKWIEIGYLDETPTVFYVRDNGIGIPEKHYETVFRMFKRLHERDKYGGGTGYGLTLTRKIVERHGGRIWVNSKDGEGSTFYFVLESTIQT